MRISGLGSGLDIDTMIRQLMQAERVPLDKLVQKKQTLEWQRDDYRAVNARFLELRNAAFDMKLQSKYLARSASSSDNAVVTASAGAGAAAGIYTIQVDQLARSAQLTSNAPVGAGDASTKLSDLGLLEDTMLTIQGDKGTVTIGVNTGDTLAMLAGKINAVGNMTGVQGNYDATLDRFFLVSGKTGDASAISLRSADSSLLSDVMKLATVPAAGESSLYIGRVSFENAAAAIDSDLSAAQTLQITYDNVDYDFQINKNTTISSLISAVNSSDLGKAGVSAFVNSDGKLAFSAPDDTKNVTFSSYVPNAPDGSPGTLPAGDTDILETLGLAVVDRYDDIALTEAAAQGTNALIQFNGVSGSYESNTFSINGITFTAKQANGIEQTVSVANDVDGIFENIKAFVDLYNKTIDAVNSELTERVYREYLPLTDEQKEEMSEKEIELWEERAKSGLLRNDPILSQALSSMRTALNSIVQGLPSGNLKQMFEIGITTGSYAERGKLYIEESKLRAAIADRPEEVAALFTSDDGIAGVDSGDGLAARLYNQTEAVLARLKEKAGTGTSVDTSTMIGRDLFNVDTRMRNLTERLQAVEDRYYRQFTAMEQFLNEMNAQSAYIMANFFPSK